ncbi:MULTISPECIES: hypothetical protein [unclassified Microbacterium]|uniref:hypothetical protein n=1 Tax=unclassified Microbacterium TaxID=2609290 RepID=UPI00214AB5C9|nr:MULTISPECIES: hypothetical protein [unclassified Microbacterium]MCR2810516.1 hypothetical protein [Microbacterium sp. zg.B185]WIM19501.1 hypothetical protein QNO12_01435 [Microbacterium sp. zg-B185]
MISTGVVFIVFTAAAILALGAIASPTYWFPAFIAVGGALASGYGFGRDLRKVMAGESVVDGEVTDLGASVTDGEVLDSSVIRRRVLVWVLWLIALPALALVVPFFYASLLWLVAVLRFSGGRSWIYIAISVVSFGVVLNLLIVLLAIHVPPALLTGWG